MSGYSGGLPQRDLSYVEFANMLNTSRLEESMSALRICTQASGAYCSSDRQQLTTPVSLFAPDFLNPDLFAFTWQTERSSTACSLCRKSQMQRVMSFNNIQQTAATFQRIPLFPGTCLPLHTKTKNWNRSVKKTITKKVNKKNYV